MLFLVLWGVAGCEPLPPNLQDIGFEEGATFDAHEGIVFRLEGAGDDRRIAVKREDGELLYVGRSSLVAGRELPLRVPQGTTSLLVERSVDGVPTTTRVPVDRGEAVFAWGVTP